MPPKTEIPWCDSTVKRCNVCRLEKPLNEFNRDCTRTDGLSPKCRECQRSLSRRLYKPIPEYLRKPMGPVPNRRDGDKLQARASVNRLIRYGKIPSPSEVPCSQCKHCGDDRKHEYHHHNGYSAEHHLDVIVLCSKCHHHQPDMKASKTHCKRGHEFTSDNTGRKPNGNRFCVACRRLNDHPNRDAAYWRAYRIARKEQR